MNWKSPVSAAISLAALFLSFSCTTRNRGITVRNPTVADMQRLEAEWGLPPKPVSTETSTPSTSIPGTGGGAQTVTTTSTTSTTTAPAETPPAVTPPAVPPSLR